MTDIIAQLNTERSLLVGGEARRGGSGLFDVTNPADGTVLASVADADVNDAAAAVGAAHRALPAWRRMPARERAEILRRAFELLRRDTELIAGLIVAENGKSWTDARGEAGLAAEFFRWYAEEAVRPGGTYGSAPAGGVRSVVTHQPVGVAALVTPWNFPAAMATRKIAPALAAGCTVVLKPAAETPLTAFAVAHILTEAGVPDGVVNVVPTTDAAGVVGAWLDDERVRKISFTGSTPVGSLLLRHAADRVVNASMELGGNAPFIVAQDADLDAAVAGALVAKFRGGGQVCTAANRFYVHTDVHDDFVARFGAAVEALAVGAADSGAEVGPLISARAVERLTATVDAAVARGARVAHRATVASFAGSFYAPSVLVDVDPQDPILDEELFGPVAPVVRWDDEAQLVEWCNAPSVGLASYVYSRDLQRAITLAESLETGMVGINRGMVADPSAPFGGMKGSGLGREGAREGIEEFLETQYLAINWP